MTRKEPQPQAERALLGRKQKHARQPIDESGVCSLFNRHNIENFAFTFEPIAIGADCILGERSSLMGHCTLQDRAQLMPMAQAMKGTTLLAASRSAGNPADTVRPSDAWWAPVGRDLVPLRQIIIKDPASSASSEA